MWDLVQILRKKYRLVLFTKEVDEWMVEIQKKCNSTDIYISSQFEES